jgi:hypothetical protein
MYRIKMGSFGRIMSYDFTPGKIYRVPQNYLFIPLARPKIYYG